MFSIEFGVCSELDHTNVQGRFEILSLSGSFSTTAIQGVRNRNGLISVSLAGPDGRVIGGGVAGLLLAASPIQVRNIALVASKHALSVMCVICELCNIFHGLP